jgi:hypothetical protein
MQPPVDMKIRSLTETEIKYLNRALDYLQENEPTHWAADILREMVPNFLWREK